MDSGLATAAARVLGISELLETILINLSIIDLARAQQVCHTWEDAIASSKRCRQIMHLEAKPKAEVLVWTWLVDEELAAGRTAQWRASLEYFTHTTPIFPQDMVSEPVTPPVTSTANHIETVVRSHPIFHRFPMSDNHMGYRNNATEYSMFINLRHLLRLPPGPWLRMTLTQPPCTEAAVDITLPDDLRSKLGTIMQAKGITFGSMIRSLYDEAAKTGLLHECLESSIYLRTHDIVPNNAEIVKMLYRLGTAADDYVRPHAKMSPAAVAPDVISQAQQIQEEETWTDRRRRRTEDISIRFGDLRALARHSTTPTDLSAATTRWEPLTEGYKAQTLRHLAEYRQSRQPRY